MSSDMKNLRTRLKSVDATRHLTKAMGLVASSKIRRANEAMGRAKQYEAAVKAVTDALCVSEDCQNSPYLTANKGGKTLLLVIAGDRGLCGGYNANIFRLAKEFEAEFLPIGKRACDRFGEGYPSSEHFSREDGYALAERLCRGYAEGQYEKIGILCTRYVSVLSQTPEVRWILPLVKAEKKENSSLIFEPSAEKVLEAAVLEDVTGRILSAVRESFASEVAARRMAMDNADKNANEMISTLTLKYNRARQSAITGEITEIVAGSGEGGTV